MPIAEESQVAVITKDLELLANFGSDVSVERMEGLKSRLRSVNILQQKCGSAQVLNGQHDI